MVVVVAARTCALLVLCYESDHVRLEKRERENEVATNKKEPVVTGFLACRVCARANRVQRVRRSLFVFLCFLFLRSDYPDHSVIAVAR